SSFAATGRCSPRPAAIVRSASAGRFAVISRTTRAARASDSSRFDGNTPVWIGRSSVYPVTSTSRSGFSSASRPTSCRIGAAVDRSSALPDAKLIVSASVTTRSESRTWTDTSSCRPAASAIACIRCASSASRSAAGGAAGAATTTAGGPSFAGAAGRATSRTASASSDVGSATGAGAGAAAAGAGVAPERAAPPSALMTSTNAKSCITRSLNVSSQAVWSSSTGDGDGASAARRSRRTGRHRRDGRLRADRREPEVRAEHALDARRILLALEEERAFYDGVGVRGLRDEVRLEARDERQHDDVRQDGAVERRQDGDAETGPDRGDAVVGEPAQQQRETDQRPDQPERGKELPERHEHVARVLADGGPLPRLAEEERLE